MDGGQWRSAPLFILVPDRRNSLAGASTYVLSSFSPRRTAYALEWMACMVANGMVYVDFMVGAACIDHLASGEG